VRIGKYENFHFKFFLFWGDIFLDFSQNAFYKMRIVTVFLLCAYDAYKKLF
jgi:hypothetical protein